MRTSSPGGWKIVPRGVQNSLLEVSRGLLGARWAPFGCQGRSEGLLGRSWRLLGSSWGLLGRSWGLLGRSWGPFWSFFELFFGARRKIMKNHEISTPPAREHRFGGFRGTKIAPKSTPGASLAVHRAQVEVHGAQVELHRAQVEVHRPKLRYPGPPQLTATRAT